MNNKKRPIRELCDNDDDSSEHICQINSDEFNFKNSDICPISEKRGISKFSTLLQKANGGAVFISDEGRKKSMELSTGFNAPLNSNTFNCEVIPASATDIYSDRLQSDNKRVSFSDRPNSESNGLLMKANGKTIIISEDAKVKSRSILSKILLNDEMISEINTEENIIPRLPKFSSILQKANGSKVIISDESKRKASALLKQTDPPSDNYDIRAATLMPKSSTRVSSLLQKANGGEVLISFASEKISKGFIHGNKVELQINGYSIPKKQNHDNDYKLSISDVTNSDKMNAPKEIVETTHIHSDIFNYITNRSVYTPLTSRIITPLYDRCTLLRNPLLISNLGEVYIPSFDENSSIDRERLRLLNMITSNTLSSFIINFNASNFQLVLNFNNKSIDNNESQLLKDIYEFISIGYLTDDDKVWIKMQLRWIIWTLASYERSFPHLYCNRLLQKDNLLFTLKWRYDLYARFISHPKQQSNQSNNNEINSRSTSSNTKQIKSASSHFSKRGSMSPLERFSSQYNILL